MGRKIPASSNLWVIFSTVLVYSAAGAQSRDDLYLRLKKNPTQDKQTTDQALHDTVGQSRIQKFNEANAEARRRDAEEDKKIAGMPPEPDGPDADEGKPSDTPKGDAPRVVNSRAGSAPIPPPPSSSGSSDVPKVAFDPMPDEIHFDGDPEPTPTPAVRLKPRKR